MTFFTVCSTTTRLSRSPFTGKERDTESGNDYFGARYYSSAMGRFMSPDFDGDDDELEPVPYANLEDPQSLNLYAYVGNNPLNKTDSNGHFRCNCQPDPDYWKHQQEEAKRQWLMLQLMAYAAWKMEEQRLLHPFSNPFKPAASPSPAPAESTPADPNQNKDGKPKLVSNPKHNPNSSSPEPKNAQELYNKSIKDGKGRFWAKDGDGVIHRFAAESNGETHWNGSTAGSKPIRMEDIPNEIRNSLK